MEGGPSIQEAESDTTNSEVLREENGNTWAYSLTNPNGRMHRFIALFFMCFLGFGSYFCYDNPAALEDVFEKGLNYTVTEFSLLYSVYSWPNVVLCFVGGYLIDRVFGIRLGTSIYMGLTLIGQLVFAGGAFLGAFWMMLVGRFIFGIGAESLAVAQNNYAVLWFKGKELNTVFGLQLSFARVGSTVNFWVMGPIYNWAQQVFSGFEGLGLALFIASGTCIVSMLCALILGCLDKRAENMTRRSESGNTEVIKLRDIIYVDCRFWLITVVCIYYYVAIFPFISLGKNFFIKKFNFTADDANTINSILYLVSGVASPIAGLIIDLTGMNVLWLAFSVEVTMVAHALFAFTMFNPYAVVVIMGLAYSVVAGSLWPLVSFIVPDHQLGTAYGVCQSLQNLGLAVMVVVAGDIAHEYGYFWLEIFFIASLGVALIGVMSLWIMDKKRGGPLNMTPGARQKRQQSLIAAEILEREKLLSVSSSNSSTYLQPNTDFQIRNRYLSRIGAPLPANYNVQLKALTYRALR